MRVHAIALLLALATPRAHAQLPKDTGMPTAVRVHAQQAVDCARRLGRRPDTLIVADMAQGSGARRLWAVDLRDQRLILRSTVAHGRGSDPDGRGVPRVFSNEEGSLMTSLGLYAVQEAYQGRDGSPRRRLDGLMVGFNDRARQRAVVLHPAPYVQDGWAGRSEGCPAVSSLTMAALEAHGLDNAILWIDGHQDGLEAAIASCTQAPLKHRFRWPWQPKIAPPIEDGPRVCRSPVADWTWPG
jgi:hypothetical protein